MIEIFNKIFSYSKKNKKYDGASLEEIKHIELKLGYTLPNGFSELYGITNGARIFNCELLEIVDIINLIKSEDYVENEKLNVVPEHYVKKAITYKGRLPLFKEKNKIIFIDFDVGVNEVHIRLENLRHIRGKCGPIVHLNIYIVPKAARPWGVVVFIPHALKVCGKRALS